MIYFINRIIQPEMYLLQLAPMFRLLTLQALRLLKQQQQNFIGTACVGFIKFLFIFFFKIIEKMLITILYISKRNK